MIDESFLEEEDVAEQSELKPIVKLDDVIKIPDVMPTEEELEAFSLKSKIDANDIVAEFIKRFGPEVGYKQVRQWARSKLADAPVLHRATSKIVRLTDLHKRHTELREPVIHGLLRRGEIMNIVSAPKVGKSFMACDLASTIAQGGEWLGRFKTKPGRVLIIDNELHPETISFRTKLVAKKKAKTDMGAKYLSSMIDIISLRGELVDLKGLAKEIKYIARDEYVMIILDAFYRFLPPKTDENDNGQFAILYNRLDKYAAKTNSALCIIHHTSKGSQASKNVTDIGAGAGVQSRATDTHLVLRPLKTKGGIRLDAAVRSFIPLEPFCIKSDFPSWKFDPNGNIDDLDGVSEKGQGAQVREKRGADKEKLLAAMTTPRTIAQIVGLASSLGINLGYGAINNIVRKEWVLNQKATEVTQQNGSKAATYVNTLNLNSTNTAPQTTSAPASVEEVNPLPENVDDLVAPTVPEHGSVP